jgi:hypothetical protein
MYGITSHSLAFNKMNLLTLKKIVGLDLQFNANRFMIRIPAPMIFIFWTKELKSMN